MKILCIIPARYTSSRFPGKPLVDINGKPMIQLVWEQAKKAKNISGIIVATDDVRILETVHAFGGEAVMTRGNHQSGTDRCCEALKKQSQNFDAVINLQGDEPFIDESYIDKVAELLINGADIATLAHPIEDAEDISNPNKVKVVFSKQKKALYFSRIVIPFNLDNAETEYFGHIGIYGYKTNALKQITQLKPSKLELAERLEQLRWLENDFSVFVDVVDKPTFGIDTPEDLKRVLKSKKN